jgi:hypothetical protein
MLLAFAHPALAQDASVVQQALFKNANVFDGKSEKLAMARYVLIDANPIEDLLLLTNKNKIPVIMTNGKIYKNTVSNEKTKKKDVKDTI